MTANEKNQFNLDSSDTLGGRFTAMYKMSSVIVLTNLRFILVEFLMMYFLQYKTGFDLNFKQIKGYAIAQGTIGLVIMMPLYGLNSV